MLNLFIEGIILGFAIAAPVGPIGLLCIHRSLQEGHKAGLITGLGAATADSVYGCIAAFGLTAISSFLIGYQFWIQLIGGLFLVYLGINTLRSKTHAQKSSASGNFLNTFLLTLTNPMTVLSFLGIFAGFGIGSQHAHLSSAAFLVFGVFLGSMLWWILLSSAITLLLKKRANTAILRWINVCAGLMLAGMGLVIIVN